MPSGSTIQPDQSAARMMRRAYVAAIFHVRAYLAGSVGTRKTRQYKMGLPPPKCLIQSNAA